MKRINRIRWNADERAAVVRRAQTLLAENPDIRSLELFDRSQDSLPKERRRRGAASVYAWLRSEAKRAGSLPSPATVWRAPPSAEASQPGAGDASAPSPPVAPVAPVKDDAAPAQAAPPLSPVMASLVEGGIRVLTGILGDPRLRAAVRELMQEALTQPGAAEDTRSLESSSTRAEVDRQDAREGGSGPVVVAGCSPEEARELEKELDGALPLTFWTTDAPREQLMDLLPRARLVIGVAERLSQSVESSLTRLGSRYVRHTGGMPALYRRLAELALH